MRAIHKINIDELIDFLTYYKRKYKTITSYRIFSSYRLWKQTTVFYKDFDFILNEVCLYYSVDKDRLYETANNGPVTNFRIAVYLMSNITGSPHRIISEYLIKNKYNVSGWTVSKFCTNVIDFIRISETIRDQVNDLTEIIKPHLKQVA
jgi:hypothetical protein